MRHVGFTGTDAGLSEVQGKSLRDLLSKLKIEYGFTHLHHGDCVGGDDMCDWIARNRGYHIEIHPPIKEDKRAFCARKKLSVGGVVVVHQPRSYLRRDKDIALETEVLIACPRENHIEVLRSGVWATVRYARSAGKKVYIVWPDGGVDED